MKRILIIISLAFLAALIPFSLVSGQEKNSEKRIKVVVTDGSDTNVVIDTLFSDGLMRDSIILKDGRVIVIGKHGKNANFISEDGAESVFVTVSSDGKDTKKEIKTVTIVSSDSTSWITEKSTGNIFVNSDDDLMDDNSGEKHKVITWTEKNKDGSGEKVIIMKDGQVIEKDDGESYIYRIKTDVSDDDQSDYERTKYVISKNGMVISIEGSDYAQVKELAKEIEGKIDADKEVKEKKAGKK